MRIRLALATLLGIAAVLGTMGASLTEAVYAATPAHQATSKAKGKKGKGKRKHKGKKKGKGKTTGKTLPSVKLTGGTATLMLNSAAASAIEKAKVTLTVTAPATLPSASEVSMPITGGTLNPSTGAGTVDLGGGFTFLGPEVNLVFFTSQSAVSLQSPIVIKIAGSTTSTLSANVGEPPVNGPFFILKAGKPKSGSGTLTLDGVGASLEGPAAEVMTKAFSGASFTTGEAFGSLNVDATT